MVLEYAQRINSIYEKEKEQSSLYNGCSGLGKPFQDSLWRKSFHCWANMLKPESVFLYLSVELPLLLKEQKLRQHKRKYLSLHFSRIWFL